MSETKITLKDERDPDFTKVTPEERRRIEQAELDEYIPAEEIDWDNLEAYL